MPKLITNFVLILLLILTGQNSFAQNGRIFVYENRKIDTIDFGMCFVGDTLFRQINIGNTGEEILRIEGSDPSFKIYESPGHDVEHEEFLNPKDLPLDGELDIGAHTTRGLILRYAARGKPYGLFPPGKKEALLNIGLFDPFEFPDGPSDSTDLDTMRHYVLIARKTDQLIDAYEHLIDFDSTYINPVAEIFYDWKIRNVSSSPLKIDEFNIAPQSSGAKPSELQMISGLAGEEIPPQQDAAWKLKYHPGDRGLDSFLLQFKFRPYPQSDPDSIVTINGFLRGFGVEQDMYLFNAGHPIKRGIQGLPDTIDIGDIRVNNSREFFGVIENRGNLAFGSSSQSFTSIENISAGLSITQPLLSSGNHIYPAETDTFWLKCRPHDRGVFIAKYRLKSDISERGIFGVPPDARNVDIIIKGRGVEPELTVANDTLDFGNVVLNPPFCLPERDTVINIHNSGNFPLIINDVRITPAGAQFYVDKNEALIEPNTSESFTFTFSSRETGSFTADVTFISNELPEDKNKMFLSASGVQAEQAVVNMPVIRSKPGMIVDIPIIIDKSKITLASNFRDTITFDETLLRFDDTNPESTASESAKIFAHADNEEGTLALLIEMPVDEHFPVNDTLIKLRFRTYLGQRVSYPLSFSSPKFGNGKCEQVLNLSATNGLFALDSVCGLEVKAHERTESSFSLNLPYPNPAENNSFIEYETAFKTKVNIYIYNSYGEKVKSIVENELPAGEYRSGFSTASLSPGIYYCTMQAGIYKKTVKFIVAR